MLAYLEELCTALLAHDAIAVHRLLAHPLARALPRQVREEAIAISRANPSSLRAPIQTLRFYHQTLQLGDSDAGADRSGTESGEGDAETHAAPVAPDGVHAAADAMRELLVEASREQIELPLACGAAVAA
jgi:hypothetical protein